MSSTPENSAAASSSEVVVAGILASLYDGRYVPGQRLVESDITRQFNVSRSSVREALSRLAAEGVVTLTLHRGAQIRSLTRAEVYGVLEVSELMIGLAARLAAENIGKPGAEAALRESHEQVVGFKADGNYMEFLSARGRFNRTLLELGGNRELARILPNMHVHLVRMLLRAYAPRSEQARLEDYEDMYTAILTGDPRRAERAGREHIRRMVRRIDKLPPAAFAEESRPESHGRQARS